VRIVWESEHAVALDKPSGMLTIPGRLGARDPRPCLVHAVARQVPGKIWIVHRLDLEASGLVLFARSAAAHRVLCTAFEQRAVRKTYEAWTEGSLPDPLDRPLAWESQLLRGKRRVFETPRGKWSRTVAHCAGRVEWHGWQLVAWRLCPETGRPHQLRAQSAARGWPIAGDRLYGSGVDFGPSRIALRAVALDLQAIAPGQRTGLDLPTLLDVPGLSSDPDPPCLPRPTRV